MTTALIDSKLSDEPARLAALRRYEVLETPREAPFDKITALVQQLLDVPMSAVSLIDTDRQWFKSVQGIRDSETSRDVAFCDHTIRSPDPLIVADASLDPRFAGNPLVTADPNVASYAGVPLTTPDGYNVGALCAIDTKPRQFDAAQIALLEKLAALVVDELELRRVALRDHLTGALSRRAFIDALDRALAASPPATLLLIDVDHFKSVNDEFGHPAGDIVLKAVADACVAALPGSAALGRIGGEEFGVLLPGADEDEGLRLADRARTAVAAAPTAIGRPVTASFGVAPLVPGLDSSGDWLAAADRALYAAKRGGRNRSVVADPPVSAAA